MASAFKHTWAGTLRIAALTIVVGLLPAALAAQARIPAAELREDLALLQRAVTEAHAGLYVYETPQAVTDGFDSASSSLRDTTAIGFYGTVAAILARIHDGHTRSLPSERWMKWYADSARVLPLHLKIAGGRAWMTDSTAPRIARGSELLSIDGRAMGDIVRELRSKLPADGHIETGAESELSSRFAFWYYVLEKQPASFQVLTRGLAGDSASLQLAAVGVSALPPDPAEQHPSLLLSFRDDSTLAVLRISTFSADEIAGMGLDYAKFLDSSFAEIRDANARDLLIDLRGNDGGRDTYGSMLLGHLMSRPFAYYRSLEARIDHVSFWRDTNVDSTFNASFGKGLIRTPEGGYRLPRSRHENLSQQRPRSPRFEGRVWVLTDGGTFSTAAEFCSVARSVGCALFVGQETGGTYEGNSSGTFVILTLPHSGVRVVIPLVRYRLAVETPSRAGRGVMPDLRVGGASLDDRAVLEQALELIHQAKSR